MPRRFLAVVIACAWVAGCGGQSSTPAIPGPLAITPAGRSSESPAGKNPNELPEAPIVKAVNGVAKLTLTAELDPANNLPTFDYNGAKNVIPTISVKPGESFVVEVVDALQHTRSMADEINLHFHGLGVSPKAPGDDVLGTFARPGQKVRYVVHVPKNQEPGLYWYHPHIHGQVNLQVGQGGMSGAIIVEGLERHLPGLAKMKQRVIVVRDTGTSSTLKTNGDGDGPSGMSGDGAMMDSMAVNPHFVNNDPCGPEMGLTPTINGVINPIITIAPGEQQFFRVVNATGHKTLKLAVDGETVQLVAIDGFALDTRPGNPPTLTVPFVVVPPAARAEFIVTGPQNRSTKFRSLCYDTGSGGDRDPDIELGLIHAPFHHPGSSRPTTSRPLTVGDPLPTNAYTTQLPPASVKRTVLFSEGPKHFRINNKVFSINAPPMYVVHVGTVEEWHIVNVSSEVHDFHIHQIHFLVKEINGVKPQYPYWADSVVIPHRRGDGRPGSLVLLMDFRDPLIKGTFVFHCHILDHEDGGMMAKIQAI